MSSQKAAIGKMLIRQEIGKRQTCDGTPVIKDTVTKANKSIGFDPNAINFVKHLKRVLNFRCNTFKVLTKFYKVLIVKLQT